MNDEIKEILDYLKESAIKKNLYFEIKPEKAQILYNYITNLQQENERLNRQIVIMEKYLELIYNLVFDYDGYSDKVHLKKLIDELVRFASLGRACNDTEGIYIDNDNIYYNILNEKIERGEKSEKDKD